MKITKNENPFNDKNNINNNNENIKNKIEKINNKPMNELDEQEIDKKSLNESNNSFKQDIQTFSNRYEHLISKKSKRDKLNDSIEQFIKEVNKTKASNKNNKVTVVKNYDSDPELEDINISSKIDSHISYVNNKKIDTNKLKLDLHKVNNIYKNKEDKFNNLNKDNNKDLDNTRLPIDLDETGYPNIDNNKEDKLDNILTPKFVESPNKFKVDLNDLKLHYSYNKNNIKKSIKKYQYINDYKKC